MTSRTKLKTSDKPASPRKTSVARLVQSTVAEHRRRRRGPRAQRRAVARTRVCDPGRSRASPRRHRACRAQQAGRPAQFHHFPSRQDDGLARLYAAGARLQALPRRPAAVCARRQRARRDRDGQSRDARSRGPVAGKRRKRPFRGANGRFRRRHRPHQRRRRVSIDRPGRRGAAGALYGARQDHPGLASPRSAEALPRTGRPEALDQEVDHRTVGAAAAKSPRSGATRSPSTMASSTRKCAASPYRSTTSPAR